VSDGENATCQGCGQPTYGKTVHVTMLTAKGLVVIEDVPAQICDGCQEQYYDPETEAKILELASRGFSKDRIVREITVPVFSLKDATEDGPETQGDERDVA
jgi:YgiT-type zinc finger domain-containing protein